MSLKNNIADELRRSPLATISGAFGVVIAALGLVLAWAQYRVAAPSSVSSTIETNVPPTNLILGNVFLVIGYFLAVTIAGSLLLRAIARKHDITAFFVSITLMALTNFSTILVVYLAPPRSLSVQLFSSAHDLVFYASAAIVIAFCGRAVLKDMATNGGRKGAEPDANAASGGNDGLGILLIALLVLAVWGSLVFAGQTRLTRTLLPEITHPYEITPSKSGA